MNMKLLPDVAFLLLTVCGTGTAPKDTRVAMSAATSTSVIVMGGQ